MGDQNKWHVSLASTGNICRIVGSIATRSEAARPGPSLEHSWSITWLVPRQRRERRHRRGGSAAGSHPSEGGLV